MPFHGGAQLAIDTTMVSPLHRNGVALRGAASRLGVALKLARRWQELADLTQSWQGTAGELRWWYSPLKWVHDGLRKRPNSCPSWRVAR